MEVDKLLFNLLDVTALNTYNILIARGSQTGHQKFCMTLVKNLLEANAWEP
jgi:hypothetical protein